MEATQEIENITEYTFNPALEAAGATGQVGVEGILESFGNSPISAPTLP